MRARPRGRAHEPGLPHLHAQKSGLRLVTWLPEEAPSSCLLRTRLAVPPNAARMCSLSWRTKRLMNVCVCMYVQFELVHQEFDLWVEDFKSDVGEDLYIATQQQISIQLALQALRDVGGKNNLEAFKQRVKDLFPEAGRRQLGSRAAGGSVKLRAEVREELLATTKKDVEKLLVKYSLGAFKEATAQFWRALRCAQKPTKLERVLKDIEEGKIPWEDSDDEEQIDSQSEQPASKRAAPPSKSEAKREGKQEQTAKEKREKEKEKEKEKEGPAWLKVTAWELRQAIDPDADPEGDDFNAFTEIHQEVNEEVRRYVQKRRSNMAQLLAKTSKRDARGVSQAKGGAGKRGAGTSLDEDADDETGMAGDVKEEVPVTSVPKRRKVEAAVRGVTRAGGGGAAPQGVASVSVGDSTEEEEEEEEEEVAAVGRRGKANGSERGKIGGASSGAKNDGKTLHTQDPKALSAQDQALINDLQAKNKRLVELCDDPLAAARVQARGAKGGGGGGGGLRLRAIDPDAEGRQLAEILKSHICIIATLCSKCTRRLTFQNFWDLAMIRRRIWIEKSLTFFFPQGFRDDEEEDEDRDKFKKGKKETDFSEFLPRDLVMMRRRIRIEKSSRRV